MQPLTIPDKLTYLQENYPFTNIPALTDKKCCIHCDSVITVGDFKVYKDETGFEYICCSVCCNVIDTGCLAEFPNFLMRKEVSRLPHCPAGSNFLTGVKQKMINNIQIYKIP